MATIARTIMIVILVAVIGLTGWRYIKPEDKPLDVVANVDVDRYLGKWHEIARFEHRFQEGCVNSTATYSLREDGDIRVENACEVVGESNKRSATGRAWVVEDETNAKLRVQFFLADLKIPFLSGRYWILALADDYSYVMVGEPGREYLWILSRTPELSDHTIRDLIQKAQVAGFDTKRLLFNSDPITYD